MPAPPSTCLWALGVLMAPEDHDPHALRRAKVHAATCLACADVLDDESAAGRVIERLDRHRAAPNRVARALLAVISTVQLVVALPWLFGFNPIAALGGPASTSHLTRDGALGVGVAAAGLLTVWRPSVARSMAMVCAVPILVQLISAIADGVGDRVGVRLELVHLVAPMIVVLALVTGRPPRAPSARRRSPAPFRTRS